MADKDAYVKLEDLHVERTPSGFLFWRGECGGGCGWTFVSAANVLEHDRLSWWTDEGDERKAAELLSSVLDHHRHHLSTCGLTPPTYVGVGTPRLS